MEIKVFWEGPYSYKQVVKDFNRDDDKRQDFGLYQIYDEHPLYSNKNRKDEKRVLLYIGKTTKGSKFSGRIEGQGFCIDNGEIYLGRIDSNCEINNEIWDKMVSDAEKILINKYAPAYNAQHVGDLRKEQLVNQDCIIINAGVKTDLDPLIN